jgi:hypothetical protein
LAFIKITEGIEVNVDKQALREAAEKATALNLDTAQVKRGNGGYLECPCCEGAGYVEEESDFCNIDGVALGVQFYGIGEHHGLGELYFRAANPATVLALLDELEAKGSTIATQQQEIRTLLNALEQATEKRIAELSEAASVNSQWKPDVCPITGQEFFMWIEHPELGYVPTYGGPFDSYTIPTKDIDGEYSRERFDHDRGHWVDGEMLGLYLIDDDEQCRVDGLEERIAELEARAVDLCKRSVGEVMHMSGFSRDYAEGWCAGNDNARHEIRAAGISIKGSE